VEAILRVEDKPVGVDREGEDNFFLSGVSTKKKLSTRTHWQDSPWDNSLLRSTLKSQNEEARVDLSFLSGELFEYICFLHGNKLHFTQSWVRKKKAFLSICG